jgi:hypothetical protein
MRQRKSATGPGEPRRARLVFLAVLIAAAAFAATAEPARAQDRPVASLFPEPGTVGADYADDAERYAAITVLAEALREHTPGPGHHGAYDKASAYLSDLQAITARHSVPKADAAAQRAFDDRVLALLRDAAFRRAVLERYRLADLAPPRPQAPGAAAPQNAGDVTDEMIEGAALRAAPFALAGLVGMVLLARVLVSRSVASPSRRTERPAQGADAAALPEELRVVRLPGVEYSVDATTAVVLEKESTTRTSVRTTTTGGEVYSVGNQVHSTPLQTQTSVTTEREDLLWVRTPDGRETTWSFPGAAFQARAGHALSVITRQRTDGSTENLLVFNHATGQLAALAGLASAHAPRLVLPLLATAFAGSLALGVAFWTFLQIGPEPVSGVVGWFSVWIQGGCAAAVVAPIVVLLTIRGVVRRRNAAFDARYLPAFRAHLAGMKTG